ncbi:MAG: GAF domain-containing protein [Anaerolineae bacterium]|nr:GAF domain-containing protein [Anaerolineae bacterium]
MRYRTDIQRDIFLMFLSLSVAQLSVFIRGITGLPLLWLAPLGQLAVIAQPFLMLRLVGYFHEVPPLIYRATLGGMVVSWLLLIVSGTPLPTVPTLIVVAYFVLGNGYAVLAFVSGAFSSVGVVRQRLRFAAAGSAFLVVVFVLAGVNVVFPTARTVTLSLIQVLSICAALTYYLGFVPPDWLKLAWKHAELRYYLHQLPRSDERTLENIFAPLYQGVTRVMGTSVVAVRIALWDENSQQLVFHDTSKQPEPPTEFFFSHIFQHIWQQQSPMVLYKSARLSPEYQRLLETFNTRAMVTVPIATHEHTLGLLIILLEHTSLFVDDDLRLLSIFAQQTAIQLENHALVEKLYRQNEDLEQIVAVRTVELQRSNEELKLFAYVASHDLQEPLRTISSYLQLIESRYQDKLDDTGREFIAFAVDGAVRMKALISDILIYSRVETEVNKFVPVNFQEVLDEVRQLLEAAIAEAEATITCESLPKVKADRRLILQLFQNLVSNALKYRGACKPEIHISATQKKAEWVFAVRDNGIGIEPQYLEQIFVVFRRLHGRGKYEGTGIGLAICKKAVELHRGRLWAESEPGKGSTFFFTIPV